MWLRQLSIVSEGDKVYCESNYYATLFSILNHNHPIYTAEVVRNFGVIIARSRHFLFICDTLYYVTLSH